MQSTNREKYKELIIEMISKTNSEYFLKMIYSYVKELLE